MPTEHIVAEAGEIGAGERKIVSIGSLEIGVFNVDGQLYALPNVCLHQYGPLCTGRISGSSTRYGDPRSASCALPLEKAQKPQ